MSKFLGRLNLVLEWACVVVDFAIGFVLATFAFSGLHGFLVQWLPSTSATLTASLVAGMVVPVVVVALQALHYLLHNAVASLVKKSCIKVIALVEWLKNFRVRFVKLHYVKAIVLLDLRTHKSTLLHGRIVAGFGFYKEAPHSVNDRDYLLRKFWKFSFERNRNR